MHVSTCPRGTRTLMAVTCDVSYLLRAGKRVTAGQGVLCVPEGRLALWRRCEPLPQECEHPVEEELAGVGVEVELVLVTQWRLVVGGEEDRLDFGSLGAELCGEQLRVGP